MPKKSGDLKSEQETGKTKSRELERASFLQAIATFRSQLEACLISDLCVASRRPCVAPKLACK